MAVFTGNRAEYGLQFPILKAIEKHPLLDYKLLVSGSHLDSNFGSTLAEIRNDGFKIHSEIVIRMDASTLHATAQAIGSGVLEISNVLQDMKPDLMVVYADRFEGFAAVIAATQMNIPTAHIEGGDLTEGGALDDSVRHAMTKLSHLHFTTNNQASNRILAMGEEPWRVHTVGFPAIDLIDEGNYASRDQVLSRFKFDETRPILLFTQHSVSTEFSLSHNQISSSLKSLRRLAQEGIQVLITYPNNDAGGKAIVQAISEFELEGVLNVQTKPSLGRFWYHGILALAKEPNVKVVCMGNSSSGIKETPAFGCPTVNIGTRQQGRLRGDNVIDVNYDEDEIYLATIKCLFDEKFRAQCQNSYNPYWLGQVGPKIANILASVPLDMKLIQKKMTLKGEFHNGWYR